jgi:hypothetical protein
MINITKTYQHFGTNCYGDLHPVHRQKSWCTYRFFSVRAGMRGYRVHGVQGVQHYITIGNS